MRTRRGVGRSRGDSRAAVLLIIETRDALVRADFVPRSPYEPMAISEERKLLWKLKYREAEEESEVWEKSRNGGDYACSSHPEILEERVSSRSLRRWRGPSSRE
ncbi:hypothetical protein KM043_008835 [Ampulex compressa]|nr:hypothetical protein KM043_008835 [Ampulex compressa]